MPASDESIFNASMSARMLKCAPFTRTRQRRLRFESGVGRLDAKIPRTASVLTQEG
jgi:hypothetical protein